MKDEQRIKVLEEEFKVLKNEVKSVLLDLREQYLNIQNPFNHAMVPGTGNLVAVTNPEQKEVQAKTNTDNANDVKEVANGNPYCAIKTTGIQMPQSPRSQNATDEKQLKEIPESCGTGTDEADACSASSRNDKSYLWPRSGKDSREVFYEESLTKMISGSERKKGRELSGGQVDLVVIAGLTQWLDQATARLGKERTEVLVEISFAMGRLPESLKDTLIKMTRLSHYDSSGVQSITASDYLAILAQLDSLLSGSRQQDNALLSILSMMKDSKNG